MGAASLVAAVAEDVCGRVADPDGRRWIAAALAALSHQVQLSTLPPPRIPADGPQTVLSAVPSPAGPDRSGHVVSLTGRSRSSARP